MTKFKLSFFVGILSLSIAGCAGQYNNKKGDIPSDDILNKEVDVANDFLWYSHWSRKIEEICKTYNISCGVEESPEDPIPETGGGGEVFSFNSPHVTVRQFLNKITAFHPSYQWSYRGGVLNIIPMGGKGYKIDNNVLMERKIKMFSVKNETPELAARHVCEHAGIIQKEGPREIVGFKKLNKNASLRLNLKVQNMSVREALNKVVKSDPRVGFWKFYFDARKNVEEYRIEYESWRE